MTILTLLSERVLVWVGTCRFPLPGSVAPAHSAMQFWDLKSFNIQVGLQS